MISTSGPQRRKILVVDDEPAIRDSLQLLLSGSFNVETLSSGEELLNQYKSIAPDLIFLDLYLNGLDGLQILKTLKQAGSTIPVVILSGSNTVKVAVQAIKLGAVDYINKPFNVEELTALIVDTLSNKTKKIPYQNKQTLTTIIGESEKIKATIKKAHQVAAYQTTVMITGESGTGKELFARTIHEQSTRHHQKFIAVNCAAIPENLIEAELFGYEPGAFTGATRKKIGLVQLADKGTLFLDEIGELPLLLQAKLLRFLQDQKFYPLGSVKAQSVDVRIISATNKNLEERVAANEFREDLFYRINVVNLSLPPLRQRANDLPVLIDFFRNKLGDRFGKKIKFSEEANAVLHGYSWPGNVRELENALENIIVMSEGELVAVDDLPVKIRNSATAAKKPESLTAKIDSEVIEMDSDLDFQSAGEEFEKGMIVQALKKTSYNQTKAADILGITRRVLKYKMDKLGIVVS